MTKVQVWPKSPHVHWECIGEIMACMKWVGEEGPRGIPVRQVILRTLTWGGVNAKTTTDEVVIGYTVFRAGLLCILDSWIYSKWRRWNALFLATRLHYYKDGECRAWWMCYIELASPATRPPDLSKKTLLIVDQLLLPRRKYKLPIPREDASQAADNIVSIASTGTAGM